MSLSLGDVTFVIWDDDRWGPTAWDNNYMGNGVNHGYGHYPNTGDGAGVPYRWNGRETLRVHGGTTYLMRKYDLAE